MSAQLPSEMYVRGTATVPLDGPSGTATVPLVCAKPLRGHGRIPAQVLTSKELSAIDVRVYGIMANAERCGVVRIGTRLLSSWAHTSRTQILRSISNLLKSGQIALDGKAAGTIQQTYRLTDPLFNRRHSESASAAAEAPVAEKSVAAKAVICVACSRSRKSVNRAGLCRDCVSRSNLKQKLAAARADLGGDAPVDRVLSYARLPQRWRRAGLEILEKIA